MTREIRAKVEIRASESSPGRLVGTIIEMGRVAGDRREVFTPGSIRWPEGGVRLLAEHRGREVMRFAPVEEGAALRIDAALPDSRLGREVAAEVRSGQKQGLSVEFFAVAEEQVQGVREVRHALVDAAALVKEGAYQQATVELRNRNRRRVWL